MEWDGIWKGTWVFSMPSRNTERNIWEKIRHILSAIWKEGNKRAISFNTTGEKSWDIKRLKNEGEVMFRVLMLNFKNIQKVREKLILYTFNSQLIFSQLWIPNYHIIFEYRSDQSEIKRAERRSRRKHFGVTFDKAQDF